MVEATPDSTSISLIVLACIAVVAAAAIIYWRLKVSDKNVAGSLTGCRLLGQHEFC